MTLLSYALLERNAACVLLHECNESGRFEEKCGTVVQRLCAAAGLLAHIECTHVHEWIADESVPERMSGTYQALALLCLAEAQQVCVRRAALRHMSPSLLAKLCADVHSRLTSAGLLLQAVATDMHESFTPALLAYVRVNAARFRTLAYLYRAEEAIADCAHGRAIALLQLASAVPCAPASGGGGGGGGGGASLSAVVGARTRELQRVRTLLERTRADNDSVYFRAVPAKDHAEVAFPVGHSLVQATEFQPPTSTPITIDVEDRGYSCALM
jgi:BRO1-like domain